MSHEPSVATIRIKRVKAGSLFRVVLAICTSFLVPFFIVCAIAAYFGAHTVTVNREYLTGVGGLVAGLIMGPIFAMIFTVFAWFFSYIALRLIGKFKPLTLAYIPATEPEFNKAQEPTT